MKMTNEESIDHKGIAKTIAHIDMKREKSTKKKESKPIGSGASDYSLHYRLVIGAIVLGIISYTMMGNKELYTIEEARKECQEQNKVLPLTVDDFIDSGYSFKRPEPFWIANGNVRMTVTWEKDTASPDAVHRFLCVSDNGHKGAYASMFLGTDRE